MLSETDPRSSPTNDFEECLLLVEFTGIIDDEFLQNCRNSSEPCQILGLESDKPILQLGSYTFEGKYEDTLGTAVLFEKQTDTTSADGSGQAEEAEMSYSTKTNKKLTLTRIFLNENKETVGTGNTEEAVT